MFPAKKIQLPFLFLLSFIIWTFYFWGFLSNKLGLVLDARPYYEHFKFFIDSISRGIYPFWDPSRQTGVPVEFFLRRIGSFNPFYFLISLLTKLGIRFLFSYMIFLGFYYLLGMMGFYCLAKKFFNNTFVAFTAYLLLTFSSMGTLLFKSFLILEFTPMVWFFYFLFSFTQKPQRYALLGMTFTLMIIATTYVPFYFITIFMVFLIFFFGIYHRAIPNIFRSYSQFFKSHKIVSCICFTAFLLSFIPPILFFQEAARGDLVMPARHKEVNSTNVLEVSKQTYMDGGIMVTTMPGEMLFDLRQFRLGQFYVPFFVFIILLLGIVVPLNKRLALLWLWGLFMLFLGLYQATPLYGFLYEHIFFLKYMRNFQFFLWLILLPVGILIAAEHLRLFLSMDFRGFKTKYIPFILIIIIHISGGLFLFLNHGTLISSWILLGLSFIFLNVITRKKKIDSFFYLFFVLLIVAIQPLEVYHYLGKNAEKSPGDYRYSDPYLGFHIQRTEIKKIQLEEGRPRKEGKIWYGVKDFHNLLKTYDQDYLNNYIGRKLVVYDQVPKNFWDKGLDFFSEDEIQLIAFDVNDLKLKVNFPTKKFLVYQDSFYPGWKAFIDGERIEVHKANRAFKGVWIPSGKHMLHFHYGPWWRYILNYILIFFVFPGVLIYMLWMIVAASLCVCPKNDNMSAGPLAAGTPTKFIPTAIIFYLILCITAGVIINVDRIKAGLNIRELNQITPSSFSYLFELEKDSSKADPKKIKPFAYFFAKVDTYLPERADAKGMIAFCYYYLGKHGKAIAVYNKAAEENPEVFWFHYNAGLIYYQHKQYDQAKEKFQKALNTNPQNTLEFITNSKNLYALILSKSPQYSRIPSQTLQSAIQHAQKILQNKSVRKGSICLF
ncbi:hypothetical protein MNBD_UNCLBAC01-2107 [hydrothermal vent metagenome]|uniref:Uncharacterized protein n=1 Tax=hydrothermal vent metagenome TaxID=652676 RepID=A0A3B1DGE0_9ZZZZ